ncbi:AbrB family transcriptional regulator [Corynebacterium heidelbergense]|uniref:AbrB family transcriptional regulator n=1 Tax=Corynebacterium heidelbergense TaxID=2055947 RepID=UPI001EE77441|nr:AbrB family transcriptional regulator [Corynebacterium heidelbergense]
MQAPAARGQHFRSLLPLALLSLIGAGLAIFGSRAGIPAAWVFAFLVVFGVYSIGADRRVVPHRHLITPAQVVIAMRSASPLTTVHGRDLLRYLGPTVLSLAVTLLVCAAAAYVLKRLHGVDPATGILATLAGGASAMVLAARDLKADVQFVTLTQYLRLAIVVLTLPAFVAAMGGVQVHGAGAEGSWWKTSWQGLVGTAVVFGIVWAITHGVSRWVALPSPYLLMSIAVVVVAVLLGVPEQYLLPNGLAVTITYAVIGIQAGGTLTKSALRQFAQSLPVILLAIALMIGSSIAVAFAIAPMAHIDVLGAYLATVPGGIYVVLAFADEAHTDPLVTVVQVLRVIAMLVVAAYVPRIVGALRGRSAGR